MSRLRCTLNVSIKNYIFITVTVDYYEYCALWYLAPNELIIFRSIDIYIFLNLIDVYWSVTINSKYSLWIKLVSITIIWFINYFSYSAMIVNNLLLFFLTQLNIFIVVVSCILNAFGWMFENKCLHLTLKKYAVNVNTITKGNENNF